MALLASVRRGMTAGEVAAHFGWPLEQARNVLEQLFSDGALRKRSSRYRIKINLSEGRASAGVRHRIMKKRPVQRICTIFIMKRYPKTLNLRPESRWTMFISDGRRMSMNML